MTKYTCDRCGKEMPTTTEGFWHLRHSDAEPYTSALQICWSCFYDCFPGRATKLGGK